MRLRSAQRTGPNDPRGPHHMEEFPETEVVVKSPMCFTGA